MAGINFHIGAENSDFINKMREVTESVNEASAVLDNIGKDFDVSSASNQIDALNKIIANTQAAINAGTNRMREYESAANRALAAGNSDKVRFFNTELLKEAQNISRLTSELNEYKNTLNTVEQSYNLTPSAEDAITANQYYENKEDYDRAKLLQTRKSNIEDKISQVGTKADIDNEIQRLQSEAKSMAVQISEAEDNLKNMPTISELKDKLSKIKQSVNDWENDNGEFDYEEYKSNPLYKQFYDTALSQADKIKQQIAEIEKANEELNRLKEEHTRIQQEIQGLESGNSTDEYINNKTEELYNQKEKIEAELNGLEIKATEAASKLGASLGSRASEAAIRFYELEDSIKRQSVVVADLEKQTADAADALKHLNESEADTSVIEQARNRYENLKNILKNAANELANLQSEKVDAENTLSNIQETTSSSDSIESLRSQQNALRNEIATLTIQYRSMSEAEKNSAQGNELKQHIDELTEKAGVLKDAISDAQQAISNAASDTRLFDQIAEGTKVATDGFALATSGAELLGLSEDDLVEVQTKLQAAFIATNSVTSIQNSLQKQSALMQGINIIQTKAATLATNIKTAAEGKGIIVTKAATLAQKALNVVANANPYVLLTGAILSVIGALWAFSKGSKEATEEEKQRNDILKKNAEIEKKMANTVAETVGTQIGQYEQLKYAWQQLGNDMTAKQKFVKQNKEKFEELGWAVKNVQDAELLLVKNTTAVVNALILRAKAAALSTAIGETYVQALKDRDNTFVKYKTYKKYETVEDDVAKNRGYAGLKYNEYTNATGTHRDYFVVDEKAFNEAGKKVAEKEANEKAKTIMDNANKQVDKFQKELHKVTEQEKKELEKIGVAQSKKKKKTRNKSKSDKDAKEQQNAEKKANEELIKLRNENIKTEIEQMEDESAQRLRQIDFDYDQRMAEIKKQEAEFAELNKKRKATGLNDAGLTAEQQAEIDKAEKLALKAKEQSLKNDSSIQKQYMLDYLKEYGSLQEQRRAIAEEYDEKIAKESNEWTKKALQEQKRLALKEISDSTLEIEFLKKYGTFLQQRYAIEKDYDEKIKEAKSKGNTIQAETYRREKTAEVANLTVQNLSGSIDWTKQFDGVGNVLQDMAKETLAKLDEYMKTDEYKGLDATNKKAYADFANQLRAEVGGASNPFNFNIWGQIEEYTKQYRESVKQLQEAQERHKAAIEQYDLAQTLFNNVKDSPFKDIYKAIVDKARENVENTATEVTNAENNTNNAGNNLNMATSKATNGLNNFGEALNEITGGSLYGFANGLTKLITSFTGSDGMSKAIDQIGGKIGGIIGAALTLMDQFGDVPAEFTEDLFNKMATAAEESFAQLPTILLSVLEGVGGVVGGIFSGLGKMVGIQTESDPTLIKDIEKLTASNEALENSVSLLSEKMDDANLLDSAEIYKKQMDAINQSMANTQEMMSRSGAAYDRGFLGIGGKHSSNKKIDKEIVLADWKRISQITKTSVYSAGDFWNLTSKQMAEVAAQAPDLYAKIKALADDGFKDAAQFMDEYIEYYKELEEATDAYAEHITRVSFDSLRDSFVDALMDMDKSAEDFSDDFKKYLMQAVLNAKIADLMNEELKSWYDKWVEYSEDGLGSDEISKLQEEWNAIVEKGMAIRDSAALATGYTGETSAEQRSTAGGYETMSEDTGQELNGRFTAIQDSNERIAQSMEATLSTFQNLLITNTDGNIILNNILLQQVRTNDYLDDIKSYTKTMRGFGEKLDAIVTNTSNL